MTDNSLIIVLLVIFWHWIADFLFQTDYQATNKSKSWIALIEHTLTYTAIWIPMIFVIDYLSGYPSYHPIILLFFPITFVAHTITDYITSRETSRLWEEGKVRPFFHVIGFDQFLHYAQLFITFYLLTR